MPIEVTIDQFENDEIREEYRNRFGPDEDEPVDLSEAEDDELAEELRTRGYYYSEASDLSTEDLIEILEDRTLSKSEENSLFEILGYSERPADVVPVEDFNPEQFDRMVDNMKMEVIIENLGRFSLDEITAFFTQSLLKQA